MKKVIQLEVTSSDENGIKSQIFRKRTYLFGIKIKDIRSRFNTNKETRDRTIGMGR